ncbi:UDP-N-acetylglucosamine--N-acetylmuramyl-(pentapeptide) pyrophosphoryl-undecaprenol N-acetylglucosamine transferase [Dirofilaria immitis]
MHCRNTTNDLALNYHNPINDTSTIVGVTSACTVFMVPGPLISNSNFLKELKMIDSDRKKACYGVNVHILQNKKIIVFFLRQMRFAISVNCIWKFSGKLLYCNADYNQLLFVYEQRRACTNLIQFDKGFSFFCAVSNNKFEKINYFNNDRHIKLIRTNSESLFLKENSDVILVIKNISDDAGFYEMNVFDNVYVEQLANNGLYDRNSYEHESSHIWVARTEKI